MKSPGAQRSHGQEAAQKRPHGDKTGCCRNDSVFQCQRLQAEKERNTGKAEERYGDFSSHGARVELHGGEEDEDAVGQHRAEFNERPGLHSEIEKHLAAHERHAPAEDNKKG